MSGGLAVDCSTLVDLQWRTHGPRFMPNVLVVPQDRRSMLSVADDMCPISSFSSVIFMVYLHITTTPQPAMPTTPPTRHVLTPGFHQLPLSVQLHGAVSVIQIHLLAPTSIASSCYRCVFALLHVALCDKFAYFHYSALKTFEG